MPETPNVSSQMTQVDHINNKTAWFASEMRSRLMDNLHKDGWLDCPTSELFKMLTDEVTELADAIMDGNPGQIEKEAADVANFAMMIADPGRNPKS